MHISIFESARSNQPREVEVSDFSALSDYLQTNSITTTCGCYVQPDKECVQKNTKAWSPARFVGKRAKENVRSICALVYDVDKVPVAALEEIIDRASQKRCIVYSTHGFNPQRDTVSVRIVFELEKEILPGEYERVWSAINSALDLRADAACRTDTARLYYLPTTPAGGKKLFLRNFDAPPIDGEWLAAQVLATRRSEAPIVPSATEAIRYEAEGKFDMMAARATLKRLAAKSPLLANAARGSALAEEGGRDNALMSLAGFLSNAYPLNIPEQVIYELVRESVSKMPGEPPPGGWEKSFVDKLRRARAGVRERRIIQEAASQLQRSIQIKDTRKMAAAEVKEEELAAKYSDDELRKWAVELGCEDTHELLQRQIIQFEGKFAVFGEGVYHPTDKLYSKEDFLSKYPALVLRSPTEFFRIEKDGTAKPKGMKELRDENRITVADNYGKSLSIPKSYYNSSTSTFVQVCCPLRNIAPRFDPEIDTWLTLIGGKFKDWCAALTFLDKQCAAFFLKGVGGMGKGLFAAGASKLWHESQLSDFNAIYRSAPYFTAALMKQPLVVANEGIEDIKNISTIFREFIGSSSFIINEKHQTAYSVEGCPRLLITTNNENIFRTSEDLNNEDLKAVACRIVAHSPEDNGERAKEYLETEGRRERIQSWISEDVLAAHLLWMRDHHHFEKGKRFLVEGEVNEFHENLALQSGVSSTVAEWVVKHLVHGVSANRFVSVYESEVYVSANAMSTESQWSMYVASPKFPPPSQKITEALKRMSLDSRVGEVEGCEVLFFRISRRILERACENTGVATTRQLHNAISALEATHARISEPA